MDTIPNTSVRRKLRRPRERDLHGLITSARIPVLFVTRDLRIRWSTPEAAKVMGVLSTHVGRPLADVPLAIDVPDLASLTYSVIHEDRIVERAVQDRAGRWHAMCVCPFQISHKRPRGAVITLFEIDRLRKEHSKFRGLLESSPNAIVISDDMRNIIRINPQAQKMFGYQPDELVGQGIHTLVPERFRDQHWSFHRNVCRAPKMRAIRFGRQLCAIRKDGSEFPVDILLSPFGTGKEALFFTAIQDATQRFEAEAALRRIADELRAANQDLDLFASFASHDFQQPLLNILNPFQN